MCVSVFVNVFFFECFDHYSNLPLLEMRNPETKLSSPLYRARETGYDIWVYGIVDYYKYLYYKKKLLVFKFVTHAKESCATNI